MNYKILIFNLCIFFSLATNSSFDQARESFESYQYFHPNFYPELDKFFRKYRCPQQIENRMEFNFPVYIKNNVIKYGKYYVKVNFERIVNARRLENYIKLKQLKHICVAQKYLDKNLRVVAFGVPSCSLDENKMVKNLTENVFREITHPAINEILENIQQYKNIHPGLVDRIIAHTYRADLVSSVPRNALEAELYDFARDTNYTDIHKGNFVLDGKTKKLVVIDTETRSFQGLGSHVEDLVIKKYDDSDIDIEAVLKQYRKFVNHRAFDRYLNSVSSSLFLE